MNPQCTPVAVGKNLKIAARLGRFNNTERILLPRYGDIRGIVTSNLQKDTRVRAALVSLSRRVQKPGTKTEARGNAFLRAHGMANRLEVSFVCLIHLDISEERKVVAVFDTGQMGL